MASHFGAVAHAEPLHAFGEAGCGRRPELLAAAREGLRAAAGPHAVLDGAGVVAMFVAISRLVDLTGALLRVVMFAHD